MWQRNFWAAYRETRFARRASLGMKAAETAPKGADGHDHDLRGGLPGVASTLARRLVVAVEQFWRWVQSVRPYDRPRSLVYADLPEVVRVPERLAQRSVEQERAVHVSDHAVVELHPEAIWI